MWSGSVRIDHSPCVPEIGTRSVECVNNRNMMEVL